MFSTTVIERAQSRLEAATKFPLVRYDLSKRQDFIDSLSSSFDAKNRAIRKLTREEHQFVTNEQLLCPIDYRYWATCYAAIEWDPSYSEGSGISPIRFNEPQELLLESLAKREDLCHEQAAANHTVYGIKVCCNKVRQVGFTAIFRTAGMHRLTLVPGTRALSASVDPDKTVELYNRDQLLYKNLPAFLKPITHYDVKAEEWSFDFGTVDSRQLYQESTKRSGVGFGRQYDFLHLTEVPQWANAKYDIELNIFPAIPRAVSTLAGIEAVPLGRGNWWHQFSEDCRLGLYPEWLYVYIPWYALGKKYALTAPMDWRPEEDSLAHGQKVYETSPLYVGKTVLLTREQLYWWEMERKSARRSGTLAYFLTNYSATPQESFQHFSQSAFPAELIEELSNRASWSSAVPYELGV